MPRVCHQMEIKHYKSTSDHISQVPGQPIVGDNCVAFSALLSYASSAVQNSAIENIKSAILEHFSLQEISNAKDILWEKCDVTIIGDKLKRRDSSVRSEKEANVHDLMVALTKLDNSDLLPTFAVTATEL